MASTLVVRDTGIGIDAAALQSLGQPFHQADASISRKFGGSGLGLAISRKLLALHGGTLTIESTPGRGTTVRAIFPRERIIEAGATTRLSLEPRYILTCAASARRAAAASPASARPGAIVRDGRRSAHHSPDADGTARVEGCQGSRRQGAVSRVADRPQGEW